MGIFISTIESLKPFLFNADINCIFRRKDMFKRFSSLIFVSVALICLILTRYTYLINFAIDDGSKVTSFQRTVAPIFFVIRYPAWLFWPDVWTNLEKVLALCFNCLVYGLLVERLSYLLFRRHHVSKEQPNTNMKK